MMQTNQDYKNRALSNLEGNWSDACIVTLVYLLLSACVGEGFQFFMTPEMTISSNLLWTVVLFPLGWGYTVMFLDFIRGVDKPSLAKMFSGYQEWSRVIATYLLMYIYIVLWSLLLIIPGIIKSFSYAMTPYVMRDNPALSNNAAIEESMRLMEGHKAELFRLYLSFFGWFLLSCLTLGIGFIFLLPYVETAVAHFYEDLKAEA